MNIIELLESKGFKVKDQSEIGMKMAGGLSKESSEELFAFLINNSLNRYLFNLIMRVGSLDLDNWPFNMKYLLPQEIKERVNESFVKQFSCGACNQILFNEFDLNIFEIDNQKEIECPKCKINYEFNYNKLVDSYEINKRILQEFLLKLVKIDILEISLSKICPKCGRRENVENPEIDLTCEKCRFPCETKYSFKFKDSFFDECLTKRNGWWFEWYIYKLGSYFHEEVETNLELEFKKKGEIIDLEVDVIGRDGEELVIYECKDTLNKTGWNDLKNIPKLYDLFENVFLVSSYDYKKKDLKVLEIDELKIIKGSELEERFIGVEATLARLKSKDMTFNKKATSSYRKLSIPKQREIIEFLLNEIVTKNEIESHLAFSKLCSIRNFGKTLTPSQRGSFFDIIKNGLDSLSEEILTSYINMALKNYEKDLLDSFISLEELILVGKPYGNNFYYILNLFQIYDSRDVQRVNSEILNELYSSFSGLYSVYTWWQNREKNLEILNYIFPYLNQSNFFDFIGFLKNAICDYSWSVNREICLICERIIEKKGDSYIYNVKEILNKMISEVDEETSVETAKEVLKKIS